MSSRRICYNVRDNRLAETVCVLGCVFVLCVCVPPGIVCTCSGIAAFTHGPIHEISVRIASVGRGGSAQSALCARACVRLCVCARACVRACVCVTF